jgi:transposase
MQQTALGFVSLSMRAAPAIVLSPSDRLRLEAYRDGRTVPVRLAERAGIVLLAAGGKGNQEIAGELGLSRFKVGRWRERYARLGIAGIERDAPGRGRKRAFAGDRRAAVVRKTLREKPEGQTHWSRSTMAAATGLSDSTVGRIWREHGLKPHRVETFKLSNDPAFTEKLRDIVGFYLSPPEHAVVLSCDEKSQIQALDRTQPGMVERLFRDLGEKALRRGSFFDVNDLEGAITEYLNAHNENPKPFIWTASANDILAKVKRARKTADKLRY